MKHISMINKLYLLAFMAIFITACATTQGEEMVEEETAGMSTETDGSGTIIEDDGGVSATPIADDEMTAGEMTAEELLQQSDTDLANRQARPEFRYLIQNVNSRTFPRLAAGGHR